MLVSVLGPRFPRSRSGICVSARTGPKSAEGELGRVGAGELGRDTDLGREIVASSLSLGALCVMSLAVLQRRREIISQEKQEEANDSAQQQEILPDADGSWFRLRGNSG